MSKIIKILIASLVGLLLVAGAGFGYLYYKSYKIKNGGAAGPAAEKVASGQAAADHLEAEKKKCETEENKEECLDDVYFNEALNNLNPELCNQVTNETTKQNCVTEVAIRKNDEKVCEMQIDTAAKDFCLSLILSGKASEAEDMDLCLKVPGESYRDSCFYNIVSERASREYCDSLGDLKNKCLDAVISDEAFAKADLALCEQIPSVASRESCIVELGSTDSDNDGLNNVEEKKYGTDPLNSDTDGDGYKDGEEVEAGYNPKGPGKLE